MQEPGFTRTTFKSQALYAGTTTLLKKPRGMLVGCPPPPWSIKGGGGRPAASIAENMLTRIHIHVHADIGTLPQSTNRDLEDSPPLPPSL
jgi:hypothetical protein